MKRKTAITLMILMLIIALCGCSSKSANTIQLWDPAEEQAQAALEILTSGGHSAFAAYEVDKSYQTLKMGIEYYQDGKLVKDAKEGTFLLRVYPVPLSERQSDHRSICRRILQQLFGYRSAWIQSRR